VSPGNAGMPEATPHTRGSTLAIIDNKIHNGGYPAYAGIDPRLAPSTVTDIWLPRIRGDRPHLYCLLYVCCGATPHTRGSTLLELSGDRLAIGYPAYAGIDPCPVYHRATLAGLPRIRGDRPPPEPI